MTTSSAEHLNQPRRSPGRRESLDEQVRRRGLQPVNSADEVARDDVFESDEELDAFLAWYHAERQANLAQRTVEYIVLDTDVASLSFRPRLPASVMGHLVGKLWCLSFVTVGEMTQWADLRSQSPGNQAAWHSWLSDRVFLEGGPEVSRIWGHLSADGRRRGRTHPINDTWIAASCLTDGLSLATFNTKDFADFADNHGLRLLSLDRG